MKTDTITIHVDAEAAEVYRAATEEDRRKIDLLVSLQLTDFLRSPESLEEVMDEMSREAEQRGLTPEILNSILND